MESRGNRAGGPEPAGWPPYPDSVGFLPPVPATLADAVLDHLGVPAARHDRGWLDALVQRYGERVPWESASRITRAARLPPDERPLLPEAFWERALRDGTGGTCFESNAALSALLAALEFDGALTVNDMHDTRGCHTALVVRLREERLLVDVGYPIHAALPLRAEATSRDTPWFRYLATPSGTGRFTIENHPHPSPYLFDLVDEPVSPDDYVAALRADHGPGGLFLDRVVIRRIVDGRVWRFDSQAAPWHLECFQDGRRVDHPLPAVTADAAAHIAGHFGLPRDVVGTALDVVSRQGAG
jgi:arylamine N-acetyltransferase